MTRCIQSASLAAARTLGSSPLFWQVFRKALPSLSPAAAVTLRTPRKGLGPMGGRERNTPSLRSGKDQVPANLPRTPREPGGEARGRRPQPCRSKAEARSWRGGPRWMPHPSLPRTPNGARLRLRWAKQARPGRDQVTQAAALKTRLPHPRREGNTNKRAGSRPTCDQGGGGSTPDTSPVREAGAIPGLSQAPGMALPIFWPPAASPLLGSLRLRSPKGNQ